MSIFQSIRTQIFKYPMAAIGLVLIVFLFGVSIFPVIAIPYDEAVSYWHSEGWLDTPRLARPVWTNLFRSEKWPKSIYLNSEQVTKGVTYTEEITPIDEDITDIHISFGFDFTADVFPQDMAVFSQLFTMRRNPLLLCSSTRLMGARLS